MNWAFFFGFILGTIWGVSAIRLGLWWDQRKDRLERESNR